MGAKGTRIAAQVTLYRASDLTGPQRLKVAEWLARKAEELMAAGDVYGTVSKARFRIRAK